MIGQPGINLYCGMGAKPCGYSGRGNIDVVRGLYLTRLFKYALLAPFFSVNKCVSFRVNGEKVAAKRFRSAHLSDSPRIGQKNTRHSPP